MRRRLILALAVVFACAFLHLALLAQPVAAASTAVFNASDTTTHGTWQGTYGVDGSALDGVPAQNVPSYASLTLQGQVEYTWNPNTSDTRALQFTGGRIAAAWYSSFPFFLNVNISDANTHKISLYVLDWDNLGRSETVQVLDAATNAILDTQSVAGFANGTYLSWNITGNVIFKIISVSGPNAVVNGIFFDPSSGGGGGNTESISVTPQTIGVAAGGTQQLTATVTNNANPGQPLNWSIDSFTPASASSVGTISSTGLYTAPSAGPTMATQVIVRVKTADNVASATSTLNISAGSAANFAGFDTQTQGSWQSTYGTEGYAIQGVPLNLPSYASFSVSEALTYTWNGSTSDTRALAVPNNPARIAACWYSIHDAIPPVFRMDINFTDGLPHRVAFYALDWDLGGRAQSVQIVDAVTNAQLSNQTVSNFAAGTYLVYQITGHVIVNVTQTVGANSVISGVFFGANSASVINVAVAPSNVSLNANQTQQFSSTVTGASDPTVNWSVNPSSNAGTISPTGLYHAPSTPSNQTVTVIATSAQDSNRTGTAAVNLTTGGVANFQAKDTSTHGSWQGVYGGDGYVLAGDPPDKIPTYASAPIQNGFNFTWAASSSDPRALQEVSGNGRIAATWYNSTITIQVNVTDGQLHQFALYALDWDGRGRGETVQVVDQSNHVLDTRNISEFSGGVYLVWNISGSVTINVTGTAGPNAVVSGLFFGGGSSAGVSVSPPAAVLGSGQTQQFSASVAGGGQTFTWTLNPPSGAGTISPTGFYAAPATIPTAQTVTVIATASGGPVGQATITLSAGASASAATFDTVTQGNWVGHYGSGGYSLAGDAQSLPSWATFSVSNLNGVWTWAATTDVRALTAVNYTGRIAACWYKNHESYTMDVNITDGQAHQISLYALDWDGQGRSESIVILDPSNNHVLDTENLSNFINGTYATWTITGHVTINITVTSGSNSVISGVFFQ